MALTRMQQRRGSASQWASENPILAAGEIGFETNNNRFKIGDGLTAWTGLQYFSNTEDVNSAIEAAVAALIDLAPETLDTLNEIAAAINDDPDFFTNVVSKSGDTMTGDLTLPNDPTENLHAATKQYVDQAEADANTYTDTEISTLISDGLAITPGGVEGQVLAKASDSDYDTEWVTPTGLLGDLADVETYDVIDKDTLVYDGDLGLWLPGPGGGRFTVSETAPPEPLNGDTWMDSVTGNSYLYYEDGDTNQWIQIAGPGTVGTRGATLFIGTVAPTNPVEGDLWYDSEEGFTYLYYVDADSSQWVQFGLNRNGANGTDGLDGEGVPAGGSINQVLKKYSGNDYEAQWSVIDISELETVDSLRIISAPNYKDGVSTVAGLGVTNDITYDPPALFFFPDFSTGNKVSKITLPSDSTVTTVTLSGSNYTSGITKTLVLINDSIYDISFIFDNVTSWRVLGLSPANVVLPPNETCVFAVTSYGTAESDCIVTFEQTV